MKPVALAAGALILVVPLTGFAADDSVVPASLASVASPASARLLGGWASPARAGRGPGGGLLLGVEGAYATMLPGSQDPAHGSWAFGARVGWAFANGLALHLRYDDLGVAPSSASSPLQLVTAGLRYSLPFVIPMPFAEVDAGPAFLGGDTHFGAGAALGASLPIGPHVLVDLVGHDWLVPIAGELRQTLSGGLALTVTFASPAR